MEIEGSRRESLVVVALCIVWYSASSASNVVGKLVLTQFPYPLTVTMVQLLTTVLLSAPALALAGVRNSPAVTRAYFWRVLMPLAFAKSLTTIFSQITIWKVPISYAHTVKATTPLWTAGLGWILLGERVGRRVCGALALIALGVGVASATEAQFSGAGLGAGLAAAALLAAQHLFSKRAMRDAHLHHLRLLQVLSRLALVMLLPVWVCMEGVEALRGSGEGGQCGARCLALLGADGALAWVQAFAALSVLARVSPLAYAVASAAKRVAVVAASLLVLRNPAPPANLAGMALAAAGVLLYNRAKVLDRTSLYTPLRPPLPV